MKSPKPLATSEASSTMTDDAVLYARIRDLVLSARKTVARGVDLVQVHTNFEIGRHIVEFEQQGKNRAEYGKLLLNTLSARLSQEFGVGFSRSNIAAMRSFYLAYASRAEIVQPVTGQFFIADQTAYATSTDTIVQPATGQSARQATVNRPFCVSWTHYVFLLGIKNAEERSFYEIESATQSWTVRELKRQFDTSLYERLALSRDKEGIRKLALEGQTVANSKNLLKEPLILEFLGLSEQAHYSESDLESALINQIEHFLLELGKGFLFEARQKRFSFDGDHFFVDLVFYNRLLRSYVLIDLKLGKLTHQDLGQMQMYVNYFDREVKTPAEGSTIGIVLCKQKHQALVEITLPKDANIHANEYQLCLPSKEELQDRLMQWAAEVGG